MPNMCNVANTMKLKHRKHVKSVKITDAFAVALINSRADRECRTAASAGAITVREALADKYYPQHHKDTKTDDARQG